MEQWWINGAASRNVDVADRGLAYGDGLFETMAIRQGDIRFLDRHLQRLAGGCVRLGLPVPPQTLAAELRERVRGTAHGVLKLLWTRGPGPRGYRPPQRAVPTAIVGVLPAASAERRRDVPPCIRVRVCRTAAAVSTATAGLKTLNRLEQVLARAEWDDPEVAEGLMSDGAGNLVGGTMSNVFLVAERVLLTPRVDRAGVQGVMRGVILEAARELGIEVRETVVLMDAVKESTEIFVSNALTGIRPVVAVDDRGFGAGPVTSRLESALRERFGVGTAE